MRIGFHASIRRGLVPALEAAHRADCGALQIFSRPPHEWRTYQLDERDAEAFRARRAALDIAPLVVHTAYLPNLSTRHETILRRSREALALDLRNCRAMGADHYILHPGAYSDGASPREGIERMGAAVREQLDLGGTTRVLIENVAGGGRRLGASWEELRALLDAIGHPERTGICLDTAHTLGAGHPFETATGVRDTLDAFDRVIGLRHLQVLHVNGSLAPRGSQRDIHGHLDEGFIQTDAFEALLRDPRLDHCAAILETPWRDPRANLNNLQLLRRWATS